MLKIYFNFSTVEAKENILLKRVCKFFMYFYKYMWNMLVHHLNSWFNSQ